MTELNKETACIGEKSIVLFSQAYCEADVIVPDIYPDISKVLQVGAKPSINDTACMAEQVSIDGRADINILYLGEDNGVYSISAVQPFSHTMEARGAADGMYGETEISVDNIDYTLLNPRKLSVKVLMGTDVNLSEDVYADLCTDLSSDEPMEVLYHTLSPYKTICRTTQQLCIRENMEIPRGKPSIEKILKLDVCIRNREFDLGNDKIIIKGTLLVNTVYCSDVDGKIHCTEHEIPFAEAMEMPDVTPEMRGKLKLCVSKIFYKSEGDLEGDIRLISLECIITATARACLGFETRIVKDAYCTQYPLLIEREEAPVTTLVTRNVCQISAKDVVTIPADVPEILQVFGITPQIHLADTSKNGNTITVRGIIESEILYLADSNESPINACNHQQEFFHSFDVETECGEVLCDVHIDILHSSYTITMGKELDLRFVLQVDTDVMSTNTIDYITAVGGDVDNCYDKRKEYCIKIYFAKDSDSLWSIAKKHRITQNALMEINNISSDAELFDGKQLMIPIK